MPLGLFRLRNLSTANAVGVLMAGAMFGWFFLSALYLQLVLGYSPLEVGLAFLPATLIWGAGSILLSDRLVMRFGLKVPLIGGLLLFVLGLLLFARAPVDGNFAVDVLPGMIIMGSAAASPSTRCSWPPWATSAPTEAGLASGIVNTAFMMGGALGLAVLASLAASRSDTLLASGDRELAALTGGYQVAFLAAAFFAAAGALGALLLRPVARRARTGRSARGARRPGNPGLSLRGRQRRPEVLGRARSIVRCSSASCCSAAPTSRFPRPSSISWGFRRRRRCRPTTVCGRACRGSTRTSSAGCSPTARSCA